MDSNEKRIRNRNKAERLNKAWGVGALQVRYSYDGHWYARLERFPAALFDEHGYVYFATEEEYLTASMQIGKQITVPKPGISGLAGYVHISSLDPHVSQENQSDAISAKEGRVLLRLHRSRERNRNLVARKKSCVLNQTGRLECEACDFDFAAVYGLLGYGFAECHHIQPLAQAAEDRVTTLADLAIVCANCHRMLHRRPWRSVSKLRELINSRRTFGSPTTASGGSMPSEAD
jgi:5-methylcytosine-specific restriction protein A